jgi:hypothetical protein
MPSGVKTCLVSHPQMIPEFLHRLLMLFLTHLGDVHELPFDGRQILDAFQSQQFPLRGAFYRLTKLAWLIARSSV